MKTMFSLLVFLALVVAQPNPRYNLPVCQGNVKTNCALNTDKTGAVILPGNVTALGNVNVGNIVLSPTTGILAPAALFGQGTNSTSTLDTDGDSLTAAGLYQTSLAPSETMRRINSGVASETCDTRIAAAPLYVDQYFSWRSRRNIVVIWCGTNDMGNNTPNVWVSAADAYSRLRAYCDARHRAGWKVIVVTMISRFSTGFGGATMDSLKNSYNALIRAHWSEFADGLADIAADPRIGQDAGYNDATYFNADKVHLVQAGYDIVGSVVNTAVNNLIASQSVTMAQTFGANLVTNGTFAADSDWTKGTGWTIANGVATSDGTAGLNLLYQSVGISTTPTTYAVTYTITAQTSSYVQVILGGVVASSGSGPKRNATGTYTDFLTSDASANANLIVASTAWAGSIDNISVRPVLSINTTAGNLCVTGNNVLYRSATACSF